jgi:hypothetical protein
MRNANPQTCPSTIPVIVDRGAARGGVSSMM